VIVTGRGGAAAIPSLSRRGTEPSGRKKTSSVADNPGMGMTSSQGARKPVAFGAADTARNTNRSAPDPARLVLLEASLVHEPRRRSTAFWLCLFLGWAGCHRFYVGKRGTGRLYLLTGGFFFLGVLVDLALILAGTFTDRFGRPLQ
jgi:hypothetical protein